MNKVLAVVYLWAIQMAETTIGGRMSMKRGLKLWYEKGWNTVEGELSKFSVEIVLSH